MALGADLALGELTHPALALTAALDLLDLTHQVGAEAIVAQGDALELGHTLIGEGDGLRAPLQDLGEEILGEALDRCLEAKLVALAQRFDLGKD